MRILYIELTQVERSTERAGLQPDGKAIVRDGAELVTSDGGNAGAVSSGGFSPSLERPIATGYIPSDVLRSGQPIFARLRGRQVSMQLASLPFVPHRYRRKKS